MAFTFRKPSTACQITDFNLSGYTGALRMEAPRLRVTIGALRRFGIALRLRALASLLLALERRRIAHPKA